MDNKAFITKWGIIEDTLSLPLIESGSYDFDIDWGDGTKEHITSHKASHTYPSQGIYQVSITGLIKGWKATDKPGYILLDVIQWGCLQLGNDGYYFFNCSLLNITATDAPDLSGTTNLEGMFAECSKFNSKIGHWDVSKVKNMSHMFDYASSFNQDISQWDVSSVTDMVAMFGDAPLFNNPIGRWNVSRVVSMNFMFYRALSFNQNISQWDVSSVTNMWAIFEDATAFINGPYIQELENWTLSRPGLFDNLLGPGKSIPHSPHRYLITWDVWVNTHPNKVCAEYTCSICITDLPIDDKWRAITCPATITDGIPHCFHKKCIEEWFNIKQETYNTCPVCRRRTIAIK